MNSCSLLSTTGMQNRAIHLDYAKEKDIVVSGTHGAGNSTLEHIWALIFAVVRHITIEDGAVKAASAQWQSTIPMGLSGRTLGLVGLGRLGTQTAQVGSECQRVKGRRLDSVHRLPRHLA
jgi:26S proteasome regulatory subunit N2